MGHGGRIKKGGFKNGRGYCGWYTNKDGKKVYLRSKKEFIYATYLDKTNQHFLLEEIVYAIDGSNYKPDFFIYNEDYTRLLKIVEVKENKKEAEVYFEYIKYFDSIGINYEIEYGIDKIKRRWVTQEEINTWDEQFLKNYPDLDMGESLILCMG